MAFLANSTRRMCKCQVAHFSDFKPLTLNQFCDSAGGSLQRKKEKFPLQQSN